MTARANGGPITTCTSLPGYGDDTERVYLLLRENPRKAEGGGAWIADRIRETGIGRTVRFGCRDDRWLIESAPSAVDELERRIKKIEALAVGGGKMPAFTSAEQLTSAEGQQIIADNYAAYVAKYGIPR